MSRLQKMIGILGFVVVLGPGIDNASGQCPTPPSGQDCKCNGDDTMWVCADWSQGAAPVEGLDFIVDYTCTGCSDAPEVKFAEADDGWELYSEVISSGAAANLGDILLASDVSPNNGNFTVSIVKGVGVGAANVSSIVLDSADASWTGYSSIASIIALGLTGPFTLVEDGVGSGGVLSGLVIVSVQGPLTIPKLTGTNIIVGDATQDITIGEIDDGSLEILAAFSGGTLHVSETIHAGSLLVKNLPTGSMIKIQDLTDGGSLDTRVTVGPGPTGLAGTLLLVTGLPDPGTSVIVRRTTGGQIDLNFGPVGGQITLQGDSDAHIVNGGAVTGTVVLSTGNPPDAFAFTGTAEFASVGTNGAVVTRFGADLDGLVSIAGDVSSGVISVEGSGDLKSNGRISVGGTVEDGTIQVGGDVVGGDIDVGALKGGELSVGGAVSSPLSVFTIGDMISSASQGSLVSIVGDFDGTLDLATGIKLAQQVEILGQFQARAVIDLNNADVAGVLELEDGGSGSIVNGGVVSGTVTLADGATDSFSGTGNFTSVSGTIQTITGADLNGDLNLSGSITSSGQVVVDGAFQSRATIDLNNQTMAGLLKLEDGGSGSIVNGGSVSGIVYLADGASNSFSGSATFDSVTTGTIQTLNGGNLGGALTITNDVADDCFISGDVSGSISIGGNLSAGGLEIGGDLSGDMAIDGDMIGSLIVDGALANGSLLGGGRILVAGESSGAIKVGEETGSLTLIQLTGGLGEEGTIEINTSKGAFNADGDIVIGTTACSASPPDITFDGCIHIYEQAHGQDYGDLNGVITVCGCHTDDLNICIDGDDNGNVILSQGNCDPQVDWFCDTCPPS